VLTEIRDLIAAHARPDMSSPIDGLLVCRAESSEISHSLTSAMFVLMADGHKRLLLGERVYEYRAGQCLVVSADLPITGNFVGAGPQDPALALALTLRPEAVAPLALRTSVRWAATEPALATGDIDADLLDPVTRLLRLLDRPSDAAVLAPLIEQEIIWRLLTGPYGGIVRRIGLADSGLAEVSGAIRWIRDNYAEPMRIADLAALVGMSASAFHRHFRAVTTMSPLQFQKRIRLQEARSLLVSRPGDVAGVGHLVGYDSPTQFSREYRRLFGAPPGADASRLREGVGVTQLP
jgi:AraC-like DNA-binding protein